MTAIHYPLLRVMGVTRQMDHSPCRQRRSRQRSQGPEATAGGPKGEVNESNATIEITVGERALPRLRLGRIRPFPVVPGRGGTLLLRSRRRDFGRMAGYQAASFTLTGALRIRWSTVGRAILAPSPAAHSAVEGAADPAPGRRADPRDAGTATRERRRRLMPSCPSASTSWPGDRSAGCAQHPGCRRHNSAEV